MDAVYVVTDAGRSGGTHAQWLCEHHGAARIAQQALRVPRPHEHSATTRRGHGRSAYTVSVRRLTEGAVIPCSVCTAPTTEELNAFYREGL
jgi:hypothetical protein